MTITADATFRSAPRISRERFAQVVRERAASGVTNERNPVDYWDACVSRGIDPLLILGMFNHESGMGKAGVAQTTHSWGNTRKPDFGAVSIGTAGGASGTFPIWRNWLDGCVSTAARLASPTYVYAERTTIRHIFDWPADPEVVWAPAGDFNDPDSYLRAVIDFMNLYTDGAPVMAEFPSSADLLGYRTSTIRAADFGGRRLLAAIRWFVVHKTEGNKAGDIPTLTLPTSPVASCHLWIGRDGEAINMVTPDVIAWCCANTNVDVAAISVELEGFEDEPTTDAQYAVMAAYFRWCESKGMTNVPREFVAYDDRNGIIGHKHVADPDNPGLWGGRNNHVDPGPLFDFSRFINTIKNEPPAEEEEWYLTLDGGVRAKFPFVLGFKGYVEGIADVVDPTDRNAGALSHFGAPKAREYVAVDGNTYQRCGNVVLQYQPGMSRPNDVKLLARGVAAPKKARA